MWIEDFAMWWSYLCYLMQPAMSCLLSSAPHWSGRVLQQCCQETSSGYTDTGRKACCLFAVAELALHNSINLYHESGGMAFSLLFVFCIVLSLMHSLAACLKLSPHCGTDLTRISCRWHMYTVPYISNSNVHSVYNTSDVWNWAILYGYKFIFFDCPNSLSFNILLLM